MSEKLIIRHEQKAKSQGQKTRFLNDKDEPDHPA